MQTTKKFIYGLFDSKKPKYISYVGCSGHPGKRFCQHIAGANTATRAWVKSVKRSGGCVRMVIFESCNRAKAGNREAWWICYTQASLNTKGAELPQFGCDDQSEVLPRIYWRAGNKYFIAVMETARFFGVTTGTVYQAIRERKGKIFSNRFNKNVILEPTPHY